MALQTLSLAPTNTTATTFRAWGSAISGAIATNGMVLTADTGQINWTTVAAPSVTNTSQGYEIWRFNDTAQTAAPIYFKLEYGSGGSAAANPQMWVTVGTGSDGAGTITGTFFASILSTNVLTTRATIAASAGLAVASTTASNTYVNGDSAAVAVWFWPAFTSTGSTGALLLIERSRAYDGTATTDGLIVLTSNSSGTTGTNTLYPTSYLPNNYTLASGTVGAYALGSTNSGGSTHNIAGTLYPQPLLTHYNTKVGGPSQYVLGSHMGDLGGGTTLSLSHYGTARTWMHAGLGGTGASGWGTWQGSAKSFLYRTS